MGFMSDLPAGIMTLEDVALADLLVNDEVYKASMEESLGKIKAIWCDWKEDRIYYELLDGRCKESKLKELIDYLKEINYMKEFRH